MPFFTYARTPFGAIGATALNPDITDVFVEDVKGDQYLDAADQQYRDFEVTEEIIKVRFGSDVVLRQRRTPNGIVIPNEILDDKGGDTQPWVPREVIPPQD